MHGDLPCIAQQEVMILSRTKYGDEIRLRGSMSRRELLFRYVLTFKILAELRDFPRIKCMRPLIEKLESKKTFSVIKRN